MQEELLPHDRRITNIILDYWNESRQIRPFPTEDELDPETLEDIWKSCFVVQVSSLETGRDFTFRYFGKNIITAYGQDLKGVFLSTLVSPIEGLMADEYNKVVESQNVLISEGEFKNLQNKTVKYRQCLAPFGPNGDTIDIILGGMRYKLFD